MKLERRGRHGDAGSLFGCTAILQDHHHRGPSPFAVVLLTLTFSAGTFGTMYALWMRSNIFSREPSCCILPALGLLAGGYLLRLFLQPANRGKLQLFSDELVFRWKSGTRDARFALGGIKRLGRRRNRVHLVMADGRQWFFVCPRLHGEDMYDQILARLDELGIAITTHERKK